MLSVSETASPSTTGKKRAGGPRPPHSLLEGSASALPDAATLLDDAALDDGGGIVRGSARKAGLSMAGAGVITTGGADGRPACSAACSSAAAIT